MTLVRFTVPEGGDMNLEIPGIGVKFVDGFFDVEDTDPLIHTIRYRGSPYGIRELGSLGEGTEANFITEAAVASGIRSSASPIGQAVTDRLAPYDALAENVTVLRADVNALMEDGGGGSGIVIGNELPNPLESGSLAARLRTY